MCGGRRRRHSHCRRTQAPLSYVCGSGGPRRFLRNPGQSGTRPDSASRSEGLKGFLTFGSHARNNMKVNLSHAWLYVADYMEGFSPLAAERKTCAGGPAMFGSGPSLQAAHCVSGRTGRRAGPPGSQGVAGLVAELWAGACRRRWSLAGCVYN